MEPPKAVDLGLPSGKLWSDRNIGAMSETEAGLYFAWGETEGYKDANARNAALGRSDGFSSDAYNAGDADSISANLTSDNDAAVKNYGGNWRMPTKAECEELYNNTNHEWTTINGVTGRKFTNKTDSSKYIFIPAVGIYDGTTLYGSGPYGYYWSSTFYSSSYAYLLRFNSSGVYTDDYYRYYGFSVRAIQDN